MAMSPLGITFIPSADNQAQGPQRGQLEGDLGQAFKILSLRLPRVQGAKAIAPPDLLSSAGSAGLSTPPGFNPQAAVFDAMIRAMASGPRSADAGSSVSTGRIGPPSITPGATPTRAAATPPMAQAPAPTTPWGHGPFQRDASY